MLHNIDAIKDDFKDLVSVVDTKLNRRTLLMASTATIALAATTTVAPTGVWADGHVTADQRLTLIRMARDIYPHDDFLPDEPYVAAVDKIIKLAAGDPDTKKLVSEGLSDLEARAQKTYKKKYLDISEPHKREGILRSIELGGFFQKFKGELLFGIYNNKKLWPKFEYDGSSWERGGFMDNFDKIDWL